MKMRQTVFSVLSLHWTDTLFSIIVRSAEGIIEKHSPLMQFQDPLFDVVSLFFDGIDLHLQIADSCRITMPFNVI